MQSLKKFITLLLLTVSISAQAEQHKMLIVIGGVGGFTWRLAKILETEIAKVNGDNIVVDTLSGGDGFVGINHFNVNKTYDLTITTSSLEAEILNKNTTVDFKAIKVLGGSSLIWITNSTSTIKTPIDIKTFKPPFIGVAGPGPGLAAKRLCEFQQFECEIIPFKSMADMWIPFFNNTISTALVAITPEVLNFSKLGKLQIVGTTNPANVTIWDQKIVSVPRSIGGAPYTFHAFLAARKSMPSEKLNRLLTAVNIAWDTPVVHEQLQKELMFFPYTSKIYNIDEIVKESANALR